MEGGNIPVKVDEAVEEVIPPISPSAEELRASPGLSVSESVKKTENVEQTFQPVANGQMVEQHEMKGKKEKQVAVAPKLPILQLWKYANKSEQIMIGFAAFFSLIGGALAPAVILIMGKMLGTFGGSTGGVDIFSMDPKAISAILTKANVVLVDNFMEFVLDFVWFGIALLFCVYISHALWVWSAELQGRRIRIMYVESILHQDMGWHDANTDSLTTRLALDTANITEGLGEKAGLVLEAASSGITGVVIALTKGWKLTLVMIACLPLIAVAGGIMIVFLRAAAARAQAMYASAGGVAEQAIASIRTVYAFSMMERFVKRFDEKLILAYNADCDKARAIGVGVGSFFFLLFSVFGLSLWYGSTRVIAGEYPGQDIMVIFSAMMIGTFALINIPTSMSTIATAQASAAVVYEVIDRKPLIDTRFTGDKTNPQELKGKIEMRNVKFHYPTRPDVPILQGLSCQVLPGESIAFVGPSGSGKSTSVSLVQRFYDAVEGTVFIDDRPIKEYDLSWLRQQIGVVGQEPVLFNLTVKQNILLGCTKPVSAAKLIEVCKMANCHNFILNLPDGYDSMVGQSGGMLSGGQKQRIAIARALIKDPKILLLDEATSALDTASERLVQKALDKAAMSRTTIIIAHRLSTIRNCNTIVVMDKGTLVEQGDHNSLLNKKGLYFNLVEKQKIAMGIRGDAQSEKDDLDARAEREAAEIEKAERESKQSAKAEITGVNTDGMLEIENAKELSRMATARRKEEKAKEQAIAKANEISTWTVVKLMKADYPKLMAGVFFTAIAGAAFPGYALLLSKLITIFLSTNGTPLEADRQFKISPGPMSGANLYCFLLLIIGLGAFIGTSIGRYSFGMAGASLTRQLRRKLFSSFMHQEAGFFDLPGNTTGVLASRLATDAANVTSMVTDAWGELMQLISCCVTGLAIGFSYAANMTGIMLLMVPFLVYGGYSRGKAMKGFEDKTKKAYEEGCEVAAEAIRDIRTVTSLTREGYFVEKFAGSLDDPLRLGKEKAFLDSVGAGVEKSVMQFANAVGFYAGLRLIQDGNVRFEGMLISIIVTMITCQQIGQASTFLTNLEKGKKAAANIFIYLDRVSKIDPDTAGLTDEKFEPDFEFKDIAFEYPARPDQKIFSGEFNLKGNVNQTIALVGPSGCGKSTTIGMLQRWYDPSAGTVSVGKINTKEYQLKDGLRKHMALVGQEPVLFDMSIRENIEWGTDRVVTDAEIIEAAQLANIHTFVEALPDKYETRVGLKGGQLSGGQKQRIAIARALIRKPKLLLLDEATSALDSESEKIVQTAIDRAAQGRTTITIAHRLSTIQNADVIAVVSGGRVVEIGKHQELIALKGLYAGLVQQQDLSALQ